MNHISHANAFNQKYLTIRNRANSLRAIFRLEVGISPAERSRLPESRSSALEAEGPESAAVDQRSPTALRLEARDG